MKKILLSILALNFIGVHAQIPTQNLIASYTFNDQSTNDQSGNGNHGIGTSIGLEADRFGNADKAYAFNGATGYISLPSAILNIQNISISLWIKTPLSEGVIIGQQNQPVSTTPNQYVPTMYMRADSTLNSSFWQGSPDNTNASQLKLNDDVWHHIVITTDQSIQRVYIDNQEVGSGAGYSIISGMNYAQIGVGYLAGTWPSQSGNIGWSYFEGYIDDVNIYSETLDGNQVDSLFTDANPVLGLEENQSSNGFRLFPNPTNGMVEIQSNQEIESISVLNTLGQEVLTTNQTSFDLSNLTNGVYFVTIKVNGRLSTQKLIKK